MFFAHINESVCRNCSKCLALKACKVRAIMHIDKEDPPFVDDSRCNGCGSCVSACPFDAVVMCNTARVGSLDDCF